MLFLSDIQDGSNLWLTEVKDLGIFVDDGGNGVSSMIEVFLNGTSIFRQSYLHTNGFLYLYDFDAIIKNYFNFSLDSNIPCISDYLSINIRIESFVTGQSVPLISTKYFYVYFLNSTINKGFSEAVDKRFLCASDNILTASSSFDWLFFFLTEGTTAHLQAKISLYSDEGLVQFSTIDLGIFTGDSYNLYQRVYLPWFAYENSSAFIAATVFSDLGHSATFTFSNDQTFETFYFLNAYGVPEIIHLPSAHNDKIEYEQNYVSVNRKNTLYQLKRERKFEVKSGIIRYDETERLRQFFESEHIYLTESGTATDKILLSDIEDNVSNEFSSYLTANFTYSYADESQSRKITLKDKVPIFDETFDNSFE